MTRDLPFPDRRSAGRLLAALLRAELSWAASPARGRPLVLALPRGGVPVAREVADALDADLDVLVTRKIGHPEQRELGVGAIAEGGGGPVFDAGLLSRTGLRPQRLAAVVAEETAELIRRVAMYRGGQPRPSLADGRVIIVDDGLATGVTARAALLAVRRAGPAELILAVPVAVRESARALRGEADRVVALATPAGFGSVGECYHSFRQLTDDDVLALLRG